MIPCFGSPAIRAHHATPAHMLRMSLPYSSSALWVFHGPTKKYFSRLWQLALLFLLMNFAVHILFKSYLQLSIVLAFIYRPIPPSPAYRISVSQGALKIQSWYLRAHLSVTTQLLMCLCHVLFDRCVYVSGYDIGIFM